MPDQWVEVECPAKRSVVALRLADGAERFLPCGIRVRVPAGWLDALRTAGVRFKTFEG